MFTLSRHQPYQDCQRRISSNSGSQRSSPETTDKASGASRRSWWVSASCFECGERLPASLQPASCHVVMTSHSLTKDPSTHSPEHRIKAPCSLTRRTAYAPNKNLYTSHIAKTPTCNRGNPPGAYFQSRWSKLGSLTDQGMR
ncbi:hypothetical protein M3J09_006233 [Ascochyta lentis]